MRTLGRKPSDVESVSVIDGYLAANGVKLKRLRKNEPKPRTRDAVFDLLASLEGHDLKAITRQTGGRIAGCKKQIMEVMPGATLDQMCVEIRERWDRWRRKSPNTSTHTANALVTWWSSLGGGVKTVAEADNIYVEPDGDWWSALCSACEIQVPAQNHSAWLDISPEIRKKTLAYLRKHGAG